MAQLELVPSAARSESRRTSDAKSEPEDDLPPRDKELCKDGDLPEQARKAARKADKGFRDQWDRGNEQIDFWEIYDCILTYKQSYSGNSQIFVPIVREAVEARATRFVNQVFPRSQRNIECIASDEKPFNLMALLEHYIRKTKLRTQIVPALCRSGDIEGHYNLYVGWSNVERHVAVRRPPTIEIAGTPMPNIDSDIPPDEQDIEEIVTYNMQPTVEVLADCDTLVLPHTSDSVGEALATGGLVAIIRRWSEERLEQAIDDGEIDAGEGEDLLQEMQDAGTKAPGQPDIDKKHIDAAGINFGEGDAKSLTFYEIWKYLKIGDTRRLCRIYYAGGSGERVLSVKQNPYWNDRCPLLSAPLKKLANAFKGASQIKACADLQYAANDAINEGMDSAAYALLPIIMTDPAKNPRVGSMVMNLAAIWQTNPNDTQFAKFPPLWKDAFAIVQAAKTEIFQVLSISPAAIAQSTGGKSRRNQAEIAAERQVDLLSTADVCTNLEDEILTPLLRWFVELDYQFRDKELTVRQYGHSGVLAGMQAIPPTQSDKRYEFRWFGVEAARSEQQMQMQISAINVVKQLPPQSYEGYQMNLVPVITQLVENTFGPRLAPEIFRSIKDQLTVDAGLENELLLEGLALPVHVMDDDKQHMQIHASTLQSDATGAAREHMILHRMQMAKKLQMQVAQAAQMQRPGPGGPPSPAGAGPRQGAAGGVPRGGQNPPGAIHQDRMQGMQAPRR